MESKAVRLNQKINDRRNEEYAVAVIGEMTFKKDEYVYLHRACMKMAKYKDMQIKDHEQILLWTIEHILDKLCMEKSVMDELLNEFKSKLINNFENETENETIGQVTK